MPETVRTYKVLRAEGLLVGTDVRLPGDFIPEAAEFSNLRSYLSTRYIEEVFVEKSFLDEWIANRPKYLEELAAQQAEEDDEELESDSDVSEPDNDENTEQVQPEKSKTVRKKVAAKKAPAKKRAVKKSTAKKDKENVKELAEQSV